MLRRSRAWTASPSAAAVAVFALAACGGGDEPSDQQRVTEPSAQTVAQPPPETAPDGAGGTSGSSSVTTGGERAESELAEDAATAPEACPDVVITPDSGNGLFGVEAQGLTCEDASAALSSWGESGFPGDEPAGFSCEELAENPDGSARLRCVQDASGGVVEFDTGS